MSKILLAANTDWYLYNFRFSMGAYGRKLAVDQFSDHLVDAALLEIYRMVLEHDDQD
jgi:hypothetical protein